MDRKLIPRGKYIQEHISPTQHSVLAQEDQNEFPHAITYVGTYFVNLKEKYVRPINGRIACRSYEPLSSDAHKFLANINVSDVVDASPCIGCSLKNFHMRG